MPDKVVIERIQKILLIVVTGVVKLLKQETLEIAIDTRIHGSHSLAISVV